MNNCTYLCLSSRGQGEVFSSYLIREGFLLCLFQEVKKISNELRLPTLHFIVADNWIDTLGVDTFRAWLKFHTYVDRTDADRDFDRIPMSLQDTWIKLGMGKKKFYEKVIRPLWEHGLIDLVEYEGSKRNTQKPVNIIVYDYPLMISRRNAKSQKG